MIEFPSRATYDILLTHDQLNVILSALQGHEFHQRMTHRFRHKRTYPSPPALLMTERLDLRRPG